MHGSDLADAAMSRLTEVEAALAIWVRRLEVRSFLTEADRRTIMTFPGRVVDYRSGRDVIRLGERTHSSALVVNGMVGRFGQVADGKRQFTAFFIPGDMADLHSAVLPVVSAPLQATAGVTIYHVPHDDIIAAGERSATLARAFWRDCVADAQVGAEWLVNVGQRNALARLAHLLCELSCRYRSVGHDADWFPLNATQADIGAALGLTGVHINRMFRVLRDQGVITLKDGVVLIDDWEALVRLGEFNAGYLHLARETSR